MIFMRWNHISNILNEEQQKSLNKFDWYLITSSREIDKILFGFERIKSLGGKYKRFSIKYEKEIHLKIKQAWQIIMSMEEDIVNSAFDLYKQHYGLSQNRPSLLEEREMKLSYEFEILLIQLKTILDLFLKYLGEIKLGNMDSFEKITRLVETLKFGSKGNSRYRRDESKLKLLKKEVLLKEIFRNFNTLYEIKNYRDYIAHHGIIKYDKYINPKERYIEYNYGVPNLKKVSWNKYKINEKFTRRLDYFCRLKFLEELHIICETLPKVVSKEEIKNVKKDLSKYPPKKVREVLRFVGRKALFNDKSVIMEPQLKKILKERGIDFNNLIIEEEKSERLFDGIKSVDGKDMSYIQKRTIFKPIGYLYINKLEYIYDRDWNPKNPLNPAYGMVDLSFNLEDLDKKYRKILNSLIKIGLVIYLKEEGRYTLIDKDLERFIAGLMGLSQFKWMTISHPSFSYFREPNELEKEDIKKIFGERYKEEIKKINEERKKLNKDSDFYKLQRSSLKDAKEKYSKLIKEDKKKYSKLIRKYNYLKSALKLINEDVFLNKPNLN